MATKRDRMDNFILAFAVSADGCRDATLDDAQAIRKVFRKRNDGELTTQDFAEQVAEYLAQSGFDAVVIPERNGPKNCLQVVATISEIT